ncbi:MAG: hypothetical protein QOE80_4100 [Actinomycetota bacterium]|nr:hypothetical protein [Actinomycetota bacterium]
MSHPIIFLLLPGGGGMQTGDVPAAVEFRPDRVASFWGEK